MCLLRLKNLPTKLISHRLCVPNNQPGIQLRSCVNTVDKNNGSNNTKTKTDTKKFAHEYEPIYYDQNNGNIFQLPPTAYTRNAQTIWIAALAFILGINIGGAYIVYNSKVKKAITCDESKKLRQMKKPKVPLVSSDIPKEVPFLIIGGGTASFSAFRAIRSRDPKAKILVLSKELDTPYMRPPLSKELWMSEGIKSNKQNDTVPITFKQWNGLDRDLHYEPNEFYIHPSKLLSEPNGGVALVQGYTVDRVDAENRVAILTDGTTIKYGECLIATGSSPRNLPIFENASNELKKHISLFKTIDDYSSLKKFVDKSKSVAVVGGGFLGSELACGLAKYGASKKLKVHQVFIEQGNMGKILPSFLSKWTSDRVRDLGVNVIPNTDIESIDLVDNRIKLTLGNGQTVYCDHIVVACGSEPNVTLAEGSGLEIDKNHGGFLVNAELEARNHLYVAGDVACFYDPVLGRRRVEHHDHAVLSGRTAGENMLGLHKPYTHQSFFWSDLGPEVAYEGIGIIDANLNTVGIFAKNHTTDPNSPTLSKTSVIPAVQAADLIGDKHDYSKGVVFYMKDDRIVGIILWNVFDRINTARAVLSEGKTYEDLDEVAKLFDIES